MPQAQQQVHRQSHTIPQQQPLLHQAASTSAASSLLIPQQKTSIQQPSPSNLAQLQQQQSVTHVQKAQEKEAPPAQVDKPTRAYETAMKAAERAAAVSLKLKCDIPIFTCRWQPKMLGS